MIGWSTVAPALKTLLSELALSAAVTPAFQAQWFDGSREFRHPDVQQELTLRVTRVVDVLVERRYDYDAGDEETPATLTETLFGMREFTLEVRVESHDHRQDLSSWAWSMLERVRSGLLFQRSIDALLAVEVGLVRLGDSRDVSFKFDKRTVHAAMFEATFNAAFEHSDSVNPAWFERALLTSNVMDPAGVTLGSPPNVTDLVVPEE